MLRLIRKLIRNVEDCMTNINRSLMGGKCHVVASKSTCHRDGWRACSQKKWWWMFKFKSQPIHLCRYKLKMPIPIWGECESVWGVSRRRGAHATAYTISSAQVATRESRTPRSPHHICVSGSAQETRFSSHSDSDSAVTKALWMVSKWIFLTTRLYFFFSRFI